MNLLFVLIITKVLKDTILPSIPWAVMKNPIINTLKIYPDKNITYEIRGDTLFIKSPLEEKDTLYLEYESFETPSEYRINEILIGKELKPDKVKKTEKKDTGRSREIHLSGLKEVGFKVEEGNFSIVQSTNLSVSGMIGKGVKVEGVFQDQGLPDEGTVALSELEEAYFKIKYPVFESRIGEFFLEGKKIKRKVLGIEGYGKWENLKTRAGTGYGKGTFVSTRIDIIPGKNGPYFLPLFPFERIVPGSEKVYLDGKLLKGGKEGDYIIDYERGTIIFTSKLNLLSQSNLKVDFEKVEGGFDKYYIMTENSTKRGSFNLDFLYFMERDLKESPFFSLSDSEKIFLKNAGDTSRVVYTKGYEYVGAGKGDYVKRGDTLIYAGEGNGDYNVQFMFVGQGKGNYVFNDLTGGFEYVGDGNGDYTPQRILYLPSRKNFISLSLKGMKQSFEIFASEFDKNLYSPLNDGNNLDIGFRTNNLIYKKNERWETGLKLSSKYLGRNLSIPFRENEANYEFLWLTDNKERYRWVIAPYFNLNNYASLSFERGYLKTDSGYIEKENYILNFTKEVEINLNYEEIEKNESNNKLNTYRNNFHIGKKFKKIFIDFKNIFQNSLSNSHDRELLFGFYNFFITLSENIVSEETYVFSSSLNFNLKFRNTASSHGALKYSFSKPYLKKASKNYYYNIFSMLTPLKNLRVNFDLIKSPDVVFEKNIEYIFVGKGKGNFSYDSLSNSFYPDEDGSYIKKEFFISQDQGAFKQEEHLGFEFTGHVISSHFNTDRERKNVNNRIVSTNESYTLSTGLNLPVYMSFYSRYSISEDKEYYISPLSKRAFETGLNLKKEVKNFTPEAGLEYSYSDQKENNFTKMEQRDVKILAGFFKKFAKTSFKLVAGYGMSSRKSPLYFGDKIMRRNYFELVPNLSFNLFQFNFRNEFKMILQRVLNPLSNVSDTEKESWRLEDRLSISRKIKQNFEINFTGFFKRGQRTGWRNTFNFNFVAYF